MIDRTIYVFSVALTRGDQRVHPMASIALLINESLIVNSALTLKMPPP